MKVFIIGIAGKTGIRIARLLGEKGHTVSGLYRRHEQARALHLAGAVGVLGDIAMISEKDLANAVSGVDYIVFTAGAGEQDDDLAIDRVDGGGVTKVIAAARLSRVCRLLLVSVFPEALRGEEASESFEHYMAVKKKADVELAHSELDWMILRPSSLTEDAGTGTVSLGAAEIHTEISRDDVAATIVALAETPEVRRRVIEVTAGSTPIGDAVKALHA